MRWAIKQDHIRYILVYGGSSAAKTYTITQVLSQEALESKASTMVLRKFGVDIEDSVYADFKDVGQRLRIEESFTAIKRMIKFKNGAYVRFRGLDDSEKLKGLKGIKYLYYNELSLFDEQDLSQGRKRLRGMPGQKIIADWNPIIQTHWIKTQIVDYEQWQDVTITQDLIGAPTRYCTLDPEYSYVKTNATGDTLLIKTTFRDNYWVTGHPYPKAAAMGAGFEDIHVLADFEKDRIRKPNDYRIYALGEWGLVRTGGEFWKAFDESKHVRVITPYHGGAVHATLDINAQPYITVSAWQIDVGDKVITQFGELPCRSPKNTAKKSALALVAWLKKIGFDDILFIYGDPSANAVSTNDDDGLSFFQKFFAVLKEAGIKYRDMTLRAAPSVTRSADFINDIYDSNLEGWSIQINQICRTSIDDYTMTKEDMNGNVLKKRIKDKATGTTYEEHGHFSDAKRYFIVKVLHEEYNRFLTKKKSTASTWGGAFQ